MKIDYKQIDSNMHKLVRTLNRIEGVTTWGSCGGHENPTPGQRPLDEWYVVLDINMSTDALYKITWAVCELNPWHTLRIFPTILTDEFNPEDGLVWEIEGKGIDPDLVADTLSQFMS